MDIKLFTEAAAAKWVDAWIANTTVLRSIPPLDEVFCLHFRGASIVHDAG